MPASLGLLAFVELALRPTLSPLLLPDPGEGTGTWRLPPPKHLCCSLEFLPGVGPPSWFSPVGFQLLSPPSPCFADVEQPRPLHGRLPEPLHSRGPLCRNARGQRAERHAARHGPDTGRPRQLLHVSITREGALFAGMQGQGEAGGASSVATHSCRTF